MDNADAMRLRRYVNGWKDIELADGTADIDGDGEITIRDAMILARYLNGWELYDRYFKPENTE